MERKSQSPEIYKRGQARQEADSKWIISPHFNWSNGIRFSKNSHSVGTKFQLTILFFDLWKLALTKFQRGHNLLSVYYDVNLCAEYTLNAIFVTWEHSFVCVLSDLFGYSITVESVSFFHLNIYTWKRWWVHPWSLLRIIYSTYHLGCVMKSSKQYLMATQRTVLLIFNRVVGPCHAILMTSIRESNKRSHQIIICVSLDFHQTQSYGWND